MRNLMIALSIFLAACQKEGESVNTILELKTIDWRSGAPHPNLKFQLSLGSRVVNDSTNAYGNYQACFIQEENEAFNMTVSQEAVYTNITPSVSHGIENKIHLKVAPYASFQFYFDCSGPGPGIIQDVTLKVPELLPFPLANLSEGTDHYISTPQCALSYPVYKVFSGQWVVTYDWKAGSGSPAWTTISDTINVQPGENYVHTILY